MSAQNDWAGLVSVSLRAIDTRFLPKNTRLLIVLSERTEPASGFCPVHKAKTTEFWRLKNDEESTSNLYVANCGPAVGLSHETIASVFCKFGEVKGVYAADESGSLDRVCDLVPVSLTASHVNIPGIYLVHDFISTTEEEELLRAVEADLGKICQKEGSNTMVMIFVMT
ncbi:hypothetical protein L6164_027486 [Bauhinia variegata]|uniref:Uncharacterized protein n=1 Tax=Bauhinia variegata TaxID=167791 RepID=A0ACB9LT36_BAUVA|nr:hypothetical protein L6164_027486 [Bauhinia variegata]